MDISVEQHQTGNRQIEQWQDPDSIWQGQGRAPYNFRAVIGGETFNTNTAELLADYEYRTRECCYDQWETLYQTKKGAFFLVGEGQPLSIFNSKLEDCHDYTMGHQLIPLTAAQTRQWLEVRGLNDELDEIFGAVDDADDNADSCTVMVTIPQGLSQRLRDWSEGKCQSIQQAVREAIEFRLAVDS